MKQAEQEIDELKIEIQTKLIKAKRQIDVLINNYPSRKQLGELDTLLSHQRKRSRRKAKLKNVALD